MSVRRKVALGVLFVAVAGVITVAWPLYTRLSGRARKGPPYLPELLAARAHIRKEVRDIDVEPLSADQEIGLAPVRMGIPRDWSPTRDRPATRPGYEQVNANVWLRIPHNEQHVLVGIVVRESNPMRDAWGRELTEKYYADPDEFYQHFPTDYAMYRAALDVRPKDLKWTFGARRRRVKCLLYWWMRFKYPVYTLEAKHCSAFIEVYDRRDGCGCVALNTEVFTHKGRYMVTLRPYMWGRTPEEALALWAGVLHNIR